MDEEDDILVADSSSDEGSDSSSEVEVSYSMPEVMERRMEDQEVHGSHQVPMQTMKEGGEVGSYKPRDSVHGEVGKIKKVNTIVGPSSPVQDYTSKSDQDT
ncbi:hypothetical protein Hanom_Chr16g01423511 [Helianthus anomalus]